MKLTNDRKMLISNLMKIMRYGRTCTRDRCRTTGYDRAYYALPFQEFLGKLEQELVIQPLNVISVSRPARGVLLALGSRPTRHLLGVESSIEWNDRSGCIAGQV